MAWYQEFLLRQLDLLNSLVEVESSSKWALVALVETMQRHLSVIPSEPSSEQAAGIETHRAKIAELLQLLCEIDSKHANRYRYLSLNM
jgi:hypothetical protein